MTPENDRLGIAGLLTRSFIRSPLTPLFLLASLAFGMIALVTLPREEEPQISVPMVDIHVRADGLRAEDAVKLIAEPLETIIKGIDAVEHVSSQTQDDQVLVTARFFVGTSPDTAVLRVNDKVQANMDRIPIGIAPPLIVGRGIDDVAILAFTLSPTIEAAERITAKDLTRVAREVRTELSKVENVGLTYLVGEANEVIRIAPETEKLALYGVTLQQLAQKVNGANQSFPAGTVRDREQQISLVAGETLATPAQIGNLLVTTRDDRPIYLRDLAEISLASDSAENLTARLVRSGDGLQRLPAVTIAIAKRAGANAVDVAHALTARIEALKGSLIPGDMNVDISRDYGETANEKANELLLHLGLATISIGILVDDAIVVIENISRHWAMGDGRTRYQAAIEAVAEVGNPTIVATLTVVAALLPMLFVSGMMGPYMSPIPANASAAMIFSFFVAVIVTPWLMLKFAGRAAPHHGDAHAQGGLVGRAYVAMARPILQSKGRSWLFLLVVGVLTLGSLSLFYTQHVTVKLLPFDNKSELSVIIDLPEGSSVEATDGVVQAMARTAMEFEEVRAADTYAGSAAPFNFNGLVRHYYLRGASHQGEVALTLLGKGDRSRTSHDLALAIRQRLADVSTPAGTSIKVVEPPPGPPVMSTLLAEIYGPDAETRRQTAMKIEEAFRMVPFIVDVDDSFGEPARRLRATISTDDAEFFHVEEGDVLDTLSILNSGKTIGYSHRGGGRPPIPIRLELPKNRRVMDERFLTTPIPANALPGGRGVVELGDVIRVAEEPASFPIFRRNGRAAEMVTAELAGDFEAPLYGMIAVQRALDSQDWSGLQKPEISLHGQPLDETQPTLLWDGEWEVTWVTFRDMGAAFGIALLGIYILVVAQFGSFKLPLVILTPIPLTFIGILLGHWMFGAPFSATSMIGFMALAGIIVRNSILLVDFIRHSGSDRSLTEILIEAGAVRSKPILLTALAAMIGAAVILTDPIFQGLAISLLFGLASSTLLTVLVIPAIYRVLRT